MNSTVLQLSSISLSNKNSSILDFQLAQFYGNPATPQYYLICSCVSRRDSNWILIYLVHKQVGNFSVENQSVQSFGRSTALWTGMHDTGTNEKLATRSRHLWAPISPISTPDHLYFGGKAGLPRTLQGVSLIKKIRVIKKKNIEAHGNYK